ncbi:glycosyltransferase [Steroidobacter sp. S1-65]|uniref:Glycosyltransferase n=1 Tax=Steroidobacter gossypii TaxID=2805490 RepID=A0ABS1WYX1_9GAMM|nr:glycosyltransferase family 4 protein [Steroidobacter gossypii]MBM0106168.1 glycosyltransferase [Steroidobacter gossypii]
MRARKRILVLTPRYPYPVIGGDRLRIYEICRQLAQRHELTLLSLCETREEMDAALPTDGIFTRIERFHLPKWRSFLNVMSALPTRVPLQVAYYRSTAFRQRILQLLPEFDCCLAHLIRTGHYVRQARIPTILEMTDAISMNYQRARSLSKARHLRASIYAVEASRLLEYEREVMNEFDLVTLVADTDRDFLLNGTHRAHVLVCSNGVNLDAMPFQDRRQSEPVIVFIGNMASVQNLDACTYFAERVMPVIRKSIDCRFRIIGRISGKHAARLRSYPDTEVCANVGDVAAAVGQARAGVAPIRVGAGIQNKILEYMALGLPVVSSSIGLEGLAAHPGRDILLADTPEQYAAQFSKLWNDQTLASQIGRAGFDYARENHSWPAKLAPLIERIETL